jgi:dTDP-4-dehydrorhamnose 3,5-epimerase
MLKPLTKEAIGREFAGDLSIQDYSKKETIEGVKILSLNLFVDDGGALAEIVRLDENGSALILPEFKVRQSTYSMLMPGTIKAFHLHYNQEDLWFVMPYDRVLVGLLDSRKTSPTYQKSMRFVLGAGRAHGLANIWSKPANMIYLVNQLFDPENPDEHRLPWDVLGDDFWEIKKG